jgi:hypothetical protein
MMRLAEWITATTPRTLAFVISGDVLVIALSCVVAALDPPHSLRVLPAILVTSFGLGFATSTLTRYRDRARRNNHDEGCTR